MNDYKYVNNNPVNGIDAAGYMSIYLNNTSSYPNPVKGVNKVQPNSIFQNPDLSRLNNLNDAANYGKAAREARLGKEAGKNMMRYGGKYGKVIGGLGLSIGAGFGAEEGPIEEVENKRNPVLDFLIGGCMDLFEQGFDCGVGNAAFNVAMCALDVASFVPGAQWAKLGKLGKIGKAAKVLK